MYESILFLLFLSLVLSVDFVTGAAVYHCFVGCCCCCIVSSVYIFVCLCFCCALTLSHTQLLNSLSMLWASKCFVTNVSPFHYCYMCLLYILFVSILYVAYYFKCSVFYAKWSMFCISYRNKNKNKYNRVKDEEQQIITKEWMIKRNSIKSSTHIYKCLLYKIYEIGFYMYRKWKHTLH